MTSLIRIACVMLWATSALSAYLAIPKGQWRSLLDAIAQALIALVFWFAMPPGATQFQPPRFGTRELRIVLYLGVFATTLAAVFAWPLQPDASPSLGMVNLLFAAGVVGPFLAAEKRARKRERDASGR